MYTVRPPFFLKWFYPNLIWNKDTKEKIVYLTFDDGPIPNVTDFVLNTLKSFDVKATFFCIGDNIQKHPQVFERIKREGHAIGNHTYNHLKGWKTENETYINNFWKCQELTNTNLFRPPYGRIKKSQIKDLVKSCELRVMVNTQPTTHNQKLDIVMWDVLSGDFDINLAPEKCYENVISKTRNGSIIVFHDSLKAWERLEYALPKSIESLLKKGFRFETL
ncbi:polysaccharide deacetylase family protein [Pedobacter xixiisoli]|uniref:Peptidoglycan/xylan/chitin deacetylase, PgdA/CDA1 family n=1 Tax=Pedobacter xixiisoli TaxID=1476464 RepID=A0A286A0Q2_9SPHI|nr:polysaccharide deacetylase family protein [Pedobacter xixiisoli]SOD15475.1 Peptidoglycan/xylan/chitin deacetylase, PgdA/CDA1 family [Pedobacter xixiisoli]